MKQFVCILLLWVASGAGAQTLKVSGMVRDSASNEVLEMAKVILLKDSAIVQGVMSDASGQFELKGLAAGDYMLKVSYTGYREVHCPISLKKNVDVGILRMRPAATLLESVVISAERPLYSMDAEKLIYHVAEDPSIQGGTTSDALQNAPGVSVDIEGNVTLRGVSSVEIRLNGKPTKMRAEGLKAFLDALPANMLDRIETITNPPAKYATKAEAIIDIITVARIKKNQFLSLGLKGGSKPSLGPTFSYVWANERMAFNVSTSSTYSYSEREGYSYTTRRDSLLRPVEYDTMRSRSNGRGWDHNVSLWFDCDIDSTSDFTLHGWFCPSTDYASSWQSNVRNQLWNNELVAYTDTSLSPSNRYLHGSWSVDYQKKFDKKGHRLRLSLNGNHNLKDKQRDWARLFPDHTLAKHYDDGYTTHRLNFRAHYTRPYSKDGEMTYVLRFNHKGNCEHSLPTIDGEVDYLRQYTLREREEELAGSLSWTHRWGPFSLDMGLGADLTQEAFAYSVMATDPLMLSLLQDDYRATFLSFNPSVHTSYRTKRMHVFKLNYSLRSYTPTASQLTSRPTYGEDSYTIGNRDLRKSYIHKAEAGWNKYFTRLGNVSLTGFYSHTFNDIRTLDDNTFDALLNRMALYSMPHNVGASYSGGLDFNLMLRPKGLLHFMAFGSVSYNGYHFEYEREGRPVVAEESCLQYHIWLNTWMKFAKRFQVYAQGQYNSPRLMLWGRTTPTYRFNLGVRGDFFQRKLTAFVNVDDLFNYGGRHGYNSLNTNPYLLVESNTRTLNSRYITAGLTLRFGKLELEKKARSAEQ